MKKKIIYVSILPLNKSNYERFGIKIFLERGWNVEYWIFFKKLASVFEEENLFYKKEENFLVFKSFFQIAKKIKSLKKENFSFINLSVPWYVETIIKIKGGKKVILDTFNYPEVYNVVLRKFFIGKITLKKIFNFSIKIIDIARKKIISNFEVRPSYIFAAGSKSLYALKNYKSSKLKKTKTVKCHSLDYERYLEYKDKLPDKNFENSIVYIDQYLEGSYEFLLSDEKIVASRESHWKSINNFLENLSVKMKKKVIIAGHPKRNQREKKIFNYEIIYNETANLIKNSSLVVGHNSTAVSLVVLFQKPYIAITTDEIIKDAYQYFSIKKFSEELGTKLINVDLFKDYNSYDFLKYDENLYKTYIENYVKIPGVKSKDFWSDFIDFFENEN